MVGVGDADWDGRAKLIRNVVLIFIARKEWKFVADFEDKNGMTDMDYSEVVQRSYLVLHELNEKELAMVKQFYENEDFEYFPLFVLCSLIVL